MSIKARVLYRDGDLKLFTGRTESDVQRKLSIGGIPHIIGWHNSVSGDSYFHKLAGGWRGEGLNHSACRLTT